MEGKKKIPCRVCGKLFKPCVYCQSHADTFRWRNFACSKECATKYINDTIVYRKSLKDKKNDTTKEIKTNSKKENSTKKSATTRKKINKKISAKIVEIDNKETE